MRKYSRSFLLHHWLLLFLATPSVVVGQAPAKAWLPEQVFVQTDRELYLSGESIWLQLLVVDALEQLPSAISQVVTVEVWDVENRLLSRKQLPLVKGWGSGKIDLPVEAASGWYQLRAYTRWMIRQGPEAATLQSFAVVNPASPIPLRAKGERAPLRVAFFPEGETLLAGAAQQVGIQAYNAWGEGVALQGKLINERGDSLISVETNSEGWGRFSFPFTAGESYQVVWQQNRPGSPLPAAQAVGAALAVSWSGEDRLRCEVRLGEQALQGLHLELLQAGLIRQTHVVQVESGGSASWEIPARELPTGPLEIRLRDEAGNLLARRQFSAFPFFEKGELLEGLPPGERTSILLQKRQKQEAATVDGFISVVPTFAAQFFSDRYQKASQDHELRDLCQVLPLELRADTSLLLPERFGQLISGRVENGEAGTEVILSLSGEIPALQFAQTDVQGRFFFTLPERYGRQDVVLMARDQTGKMLPLQMTEAFLPAPTPLSFLLAFDSVQVQQLQNYRQLQQIEQAYRDFHPLAAPATSPVNQPFYQKLNERYDLDDYTRFPIEETFREFIYPVKVRKKGRQYQVTVYDGELKEELLDRPLLLLDGIPVFSDNAFIAIDTRLIERVELLTTGYFLGRRFWGGMVHLISYRKDGNALPANSLALRRPWEGLSAPPQYLAPTKNGDSDFRSLWQWGQLRLDQSGSIQLDLPPIARKDAWTLRVLGIGAQGGVIQRTNSEIE